jgi:pilus assembly protein CpaF
VTPEYEPGTNGDAGAITAAVDFDPRWTELVYNVHQRLLQEMDLEAIQKLDAERAKQAVEASVRTLVNQMAGQVRGDDRERLVRRVVDEAIGLGPIQGLIDDPSVSEVMVNAPDEVYYERDGVIYLSTQRFRDSGHIMRIVERILAPLGRHVDETSPYVDARLIDGSRVNVVIPPLVPKSPTVTIRKFRVDKYTMADLIEGDTLPEDIANVMRTCVQMRLNLIVSGGAGTGKTTLLNALSGYIPSRERIITIEDPVELRLQQRHVIAMEGRPANIEGRNEVTQRDLFRNALRMRPDRIIVGEVRGAEAFDMLQAMNTGHEGSMTTVHANSPRDALSRIENMVLMAGLDLPVRVIREQLASALHLVVQIARFSDGRRRVTALSEVIGLEGQMVTMQEIFRFEEEGVDSEGRVLGKLRPTGIIPSFAERFARMGISLDFGTPAQKWA